MFKNLIDFSRVFHRDKTETTLVFVLVILIALGLIFWFAYYLASPHLEGYQAVFLSNNQVYFGKVSYPTHRYVKLTDIYYLQLKQPIQLQGGKESIQKQPEWSLVKLGNEPHGPQDEMIINRDHILFIENLKEDSKVVKAIKEYKAKHKK